MPLFLALFSLGLYLLFFGGTFHSIDEEIYLRMTQSITRKQSWDIKPIEYSPDFSVARGLDNAMYGNRNPGLPIVSVPFFLLGDALTPFSTGYNEPAADGMAQPTTFTLTLTLANALITALTVFLLFYTVTALGYGSRAAAATSLLFAMGTIAWLYASKSYFGEPLLMLCTLRAFYWAVKFRNQAAQPHRRLHWKQIAFAASSGLCVGYAVFTKVTALAIVPFLIWYLVDSSRKTHMDRDHAIKAIVSFGVMVSSFLALLGWYNIARFGNLFKTGYEVAEAGAESVLITNPFDLLAGLYGLLLSPGKGLLFFAPPVIIGLLGFAAFWKAHRSEALLLIGVILTTIVGVVLWRDWSGGWCWGPRLILNILPLVMIPAAAAIERGPLSGRSRRWVWPAFLVVGSLTQVLGVLPNYLDWYMMVGNGYAVYYDPRFTPLFGHLKLLLAGRLDLFWLNTNIFFPNAGIVMMILFIALLLATVGMGLLVIHYWRNAQVLPEDLEESTN